MKAGNIGGAVTDRGVRVFPMAVPLGRTAIGKTHTPVAHALSAFAEQGVYGGGWADAHDMSALRACPGQQCGLE